MIVPTYWAEARLQHREGRRQVTVRRFGWSDESLQDAQAHAQSRVEDAMSRVMAGEALPRRELRAAYGEGVPIREEIVRREGDAVITRNSYGALCLNVPDVAFADLDFEPAPRQGLPWPWVAMVFAYTLIGVTMFSRWWWGVLAAVVATWAVGRIVRDWRQRRFLRDGTPEQRAWRRVEAFVAAHPDWHLRVYRTPGGYRVLVLHKRMEARSPEVAALFAELAVDPLYACLCDAQNCFRARLTAKPWRAGVREPIRPRYAAWNPEQAELPKRVAWIEQYSRAAAGYAACRFQAEFGAGRVDPRVRAIVRLHDAECRSAEDLPLA